MQEILNENEVHVAHDDNCSPLSLVRMYVLPKVQCTVANFSCSALWLYFRADINNGEFAWGSFYFLFFLLLGIYLKCLL